MRMECKSILELLAKWLLVEYDESVSRECDRNRNVVCLSSVLKHNLTDFEKTIVLRNIFLKIKNKFFLNVLNFSKFY